MWKEKISIMNAKLSKLNTSLVKKSIITALAVSTLTFHSVAATNGNSSTFETVYHVYFSDQYLGVVSDQSMAEELIDTKMEEQAKKYDVETVKIAEELTYIPEQVFTKNINNASVLRKISESIVIQSEAIGIQIDEKTVAYVESSEEADQVLKNIKLLYVSEDELSQWEQESQSSSPLPELTEDETRIIDISFSKKVTHTETNIDPAKILSVEEAVAFLTKGTLEEKKYQVQAGDVLGSIANEHDLSTAELLSINPDLTEDSVLQLDDTINVTVHQPFISLAITKEMKNIETIPYEKEVIEDESMWKGDTKVKQEGKDGEKSVTYGVTSINGIQTAKEITKEQIVSEPVDYIVIKGTKVVPSRGSGNFVWPTNGGYVSSHMGPRWGSVHKGMDIARPSNLTIKTVDNGVVTSAGWDSGGYGNKVVVDHQNGFVTVYAHLSAIHVSSGQTVAQGSSLGLMGATGQSTGVHLHIEVYKNGVLVNPKDYL
ncbi:M23 family metallopeptidase [Bacillus sp. 2205SS5-2]|uniref:M23 family metallopeptidase n=1 Tax=Bacillus sp. 2205SS5-2 TaxID=3109031 RepID=UPI0030065C01